MPLVGFYLLAYCQDVIGYTAVCMQVT